PHRLPSGEPGDVGGDREQLRAVVRRLRAVHAAEEAAADPVLQAEEPTLAPARLREGGGDPRIGEGAEALPRVEVAVAAGEVVPHELRRVLRGVLHDVEAQTDLR